MLPPNFLRRKARERGLSGDIHNRIFEASIEVLVESGFSMACTNRIAQRAGVSVGSIYRFYPNKEAIYHAIAEEVLNGFMCVSNNALELGGTIRSWGEVIDAYIDGVAIFYQENAALIRAWNVMRGDPSIREADDRLGDELLRNWADYFAITVPGLSNVECRCISMMVLWPSSRLLELSVADPSGTDLELVAETKLLVHAYLEATFASKSPDGELA
jgi:AcrR family transcriptional regulator